MKCNPMLQLHALLEYQRSRDALHFIWLSHDIMLSHDIILSHGIMQSHDIILSHGIMQSHDIMLSHDISFNHQLITCETVHPKAPDILLLLSLS